MEEFDEALLDIGWKNLEAQENKYRELDTKAIAVISVTGVIITLIPKPPNVPWLLGLYILTSLSFLVAIYLNIRVIRIREYKGLLTNNLIKELRDKPKERQLGGIIGSIAQTQENLCKATREKTKDLKLAVKVFGLSVLLLVFYTFSSVL